MLVIIAVEVIYLLIAVLYFVKYNDIRFLKPMPISFMLFGGFSSMIFSMFKFAPNILQSTVLTGANA